MSPASSSTPRVTMTSDPTDEMPCTMVARSTSTGDDRNRSTSCWSSPSWAVNRLTTCTRSSDSTRSRWAMDDGVLGIVTRARQRVVGPSVVSRIRGREGLQQAGRQRRPRPDVAPALGQRREHRQAEAHRDQVQSGRIVTERTLVVAPVATTAQLLDDGLRRLPALVEPSARRWRMGSSYGATTRACSSSGSQAAPGSPSTSRAARRSAWRAGSTGVRRLMRHVLGHRRERQPLDDLAQQVDPVPPTSDTVRSGHIGRLGDLALPALAMLRSEYTSLPRPRPLARASPDRRA